MLAENGEEVARGAKIAVAKGGRTRAILAILGRGALTVIALTLTAFGWLTACVWYLFGLALAARRFGLWLGRKIWRRGARRQLRAMAPPARMTAARAHVARRHAEFPGLRNGRALFNS